MTFELLDRAGMVLPGIGVHDLNLVFLDAGQQNVQRKTTETGTSFDKGQRFAGNQMAVDYKGLGCERLQISQQSELKIRAFDGQALREGSCATSVVKNLACHASIAKIANCIREQESSAFGVASGLQNAMKLELLAAELGLESCQARLGESDSKDGRDIRLFVKVTVREDRQKVISDARRLLAADEHSGEAHHNHATVSSHVTDAGSREFIDQDGSRSFDDHVGRSYAQGHVGGARGWDAANQNGNGAGRQDWAANVRYGRDAGGDHRTGVHVPYASCGHSHVR